MQLLSSVLVWLYFFNAIFIVGVQITLGVNFVIHVPGARKHLILIQSIKHHSSKIDEFESNFEVRVISFTITNAATIML